MAPRLALVTALLAVSVTAPRISAQLAAPPAPALLDALQSLRDANADAGADADARDTTPVAPSPLAPSPPRPTRASPPPLAKPLVFEPPLAPLAPLAPAAAAPEPEALLCPSPRKLREPSTSRASTRRRKPPPSPSTRTSPPPRHPPRHPLQHPSSPPPAISWSTSPSATAASSLPPRPSRPSSFAATARARAGRAPRAPPSESSPSARAARGPPVPPVPRPSARAFAIGADVDADVDLRRALAPFVGGVAFRSSFGARVNARTRGGFSVGAPRGFPATRSRARVLHSSRGR